MDFFDQQAGASSDDDFLVPSSQPDNQRPRKRRKVARVDDDASDYDLPSHDLDEDLEPQHRSKYEDVMHVIQHAETQKDVFVTQLSQPWSSPTRIRGPRWVKKTAKASPTTQAPAVLQESLSHMQTQDEADPVVGPINVPWENEFDDDDPALLEAFMSSPGQPSALVASPSPNRPVNDNRTRFPPSSMRQTTLFGTSTQRPSNSAQSGRVHNWPLADRQENPTHHKIDLEAMKTWVYPTNLGRIRDYQYNIVHKSLFNNLLVALPTGLGKTFIAATVMLNWYRWTKDAQIVFVAPTRPLVNQQAEACYVIAGIPKRETIILTGEVNSDVRAEDWEDKRVFFMTPQTFFNDLDRGRADPKRIVLLVIDEAHKATGNYSYVQVVSFLRKHNSSFRVLALTATPGASVDAVQSVIDGLDIARVEIRTEESIDIRDFVYARDTQLEIFDNSDELNTIVELFGAAVGPVLSQLNSQNAHWSRDPTMITLFGLKKSRDSWNNTAGKNAGWGTKKWVNGMFTTLMKLAHNLSLLKFHGIGPFYRNMLSFEEQSNSLGKSAKQIVQDQHFKKSMNYMRTWVGNAQFVGHPKLEYLKEVVLNHFLDAGEAQFSASGRPAADTRMMIFAHFRDSAEEVVRVLNLHGPLIKPHIFVGQSGTKGSDGMNQKMQLDILRKFKDGTYNTLVATSIGEEGLDIGEVDLIVCYDSSASPIRMLQRMGRTGRKRAGKIVVLLMRGKEEGDFHKAKDNYLKMQGIIESGQEFHFHDDRSARIVPKQIIPVVDKRQVEIPVENTQGPLPDHSKRRPKKRHTKPAKQFFMPEGAETGFNFLGTRHKKHATKATQAKSNLDIQEAALPCLDDIVLSAEDQSKLEQNYQQIAGKDPQFIQEINFGADAASSGVLRATARITHSAVSTSLATVLGGMRKPSGDWTRPSPLCLQDLCTHLDGEGVNTSAKQIPVATPPRRRQPAGVVSSDTMTPDEDAEGEVAFESDPENGGSPDTSPDLSVILKLGKKNAASAEEPYWQSQRSVQETTHADEDVPDLDEIFGEPQQRSRSLLSPSARKSAKKTSRGRARRVVDSDDE